MKHQATSYQANRSPVIGWKNWTACEAQTGVLPTEQSVGQPGSYHPTSSRKTEKRIPRSTRCHRSNPFPPSITLLACPWLRLQPCLLALTLTPEMKWQYRSVQSRVLKSPLRRAWTSLSRSMVSKCARALSSCYQPLPDFPSPSEVCYRQLHLSGSSQRLTKITLPSQSSSCCALVGGSVEEEQSFPIHVIPTPETSSICIPHGRFALALLLPACASPTLRRISSSNRRDLPLCLCIISIWGPTLPQQYLQ